MADDRRIRIFDTTLRDGEQSPGASMNHGREGRGGPAPSRRSASTSSRPGSRSPRQGDFEAVRAIADRGHRGNRLRPGPVQRPRHRPRLRRRSQYAQTPRIHVFLATSAIHREHKLKMTREQVIERAVESVRTPRAAAPTSSSAPRTPRGPRSTSSATSSRPRSRPAQRRSTSPTPSATPCRRSTPAVIRTLASGCRTSTRRSSASTATTTWAWPSPTAWPPARSAPGRSSARSTASASARATPRSKRSSWP